VCSSDLQFSCKLLSNGRSNGPFSIEKNNSIIQYNKKKTAVTGSKGTQAAIDMEYTNGDRLKLTGVSGIYSSVITDVPVSDKTITFAFEVCTDGDNNNYPVVKIYEQVWMAENLKTTRYNDGITSINYVSLDASWGILTAPAYCWYFYNEAYKNIYGALYNWYTVNTGNLCPTGWHMPNDTEWATLINNLGGESVAGGKLKETGLIHWIDPNIGATNGSGFTALPGESRLYSGSFGAGTIGYSGYWWSTPELDASNSWAFSLSYDFNGISKMYFDKKYGFSVRCLMN
jgi:uncharacterized protein (TIGR02145 family)